MTAYQHRQHGFTLLEALLAGTLLAASALAIGSGLNLSVRATASAVEYQHAAEQLNQIMTRVDLIGPRRLYAEGPLEGRCDPPFEEIRWQLDIKPPQLNDLYQVQATLEWTSAYGQRSATVYTQLNDPVESRSSHLRWEDL